MRDKFEPALSNYNSNQFDMKLRPDKRLGATLIELLCVVGIIGILLAMYLPAIMRVFNKVRKMFGH